MDERPRGGARAHSASTSRRASPTGGAPAGSPRTSPSATAVTRARPSPPSNTRRPRRRRFSSAPASRPRTIRCATARTNLFRKFRRHTCQNKPQSSRRSWPSRQHQPSTRGRKARVRPVACPSVSILTDATRLTQMQAGRIDLKAEIREPALTCSLAGQHGESEAELLGQRRDLAHERHRPAQRALFRRHHLRRPSHRQRSLHDGNPLRQRQTQDLGQRTASPASTSPSPTAKPPKTIRSRSASN